MGQRNRLIAVLALAALLAGGAIWYFARQAGRAKDELGLAASRTLSAVFTRTSALAHTYLPVRAGADIAFLGGVVNYILSNEKDFREYVLAYTNASMIVSDDFRDTEDLDGLFSGYDPETNTYDQSSWMYAGSEEHGGESGDSETASAPCWASSSRRTASRCRPTCPATRPCRTRGASSRS